MNIIENKKGITLISLIVTIIILIILSGISINLLLGDTGIITKAKNAKKEQDIVRIDEKLELEKAELAIVENGKLDVNKYLEQIKTKGIIEEIDIDRINEESVNITVEGKHVFLVEKEEPNNIKIEYIGEPGNLIPKIEIISISNTTNSITINFKLRYAAKYKLLIKEEGQEYRKEKEEIVSTNQISYTFNNLNQSATYTIKIEAESEKGATAQKEETIGMDTIPTPSITVADADTWTKSKSITITTASGYTTKYTTDGTIPSGSNGTIYTGEFTVDSNCIITAVYLDSANQIGSGATNEITKIDTTAPISVSVSAGTVSNKTITLTGRATDEQSGIKSYKFYVNGSLKTTITTSNTSTTYDWTSTFGDHTAYIIVEDNVGRTITSSIINFSDYTIATKTELEAFRDSVNNVGNTYEGKTIAQTANIDLQGSESNQWIPIGNTNTNWYFNGTYDGNNYTISGIYINNSTASYQALFSILYGNIKNLKVSGRIIGNTYVAGISGANFGDIINCVNSCIVVGNAGIAGISGVNDGGLISQCINLGTITLNEVENTEDQGGITAINAGTVKLCINKGIIINNAKIGCDMGGIVGQNAGEGNPIIENCYNIGEIRGNNINRVGGIVGWNWSGTTKNCYNIGNVKGAIEYAGVVGDNATLYTGTVINTYYLSGTCNIGIYNGTGEATEKTSEQLKALSEILGSAFKADTGNINYGYPILTWQ